MAADPLYTGGLQRRLDGNSAVSSGSSLDIESGASLKIAGVSVTATATQINQYCVQAYSADIGTAGSVFVACPFAGTIKMLTAVNGTANAGTKTVLGAKIATVAVTAPAWEVAVTAAAGTAVSVAPTAANVVTAGQVLEITFDGGSNVVTTAHFTVCIERS